MQTENRTMAAERSKLKSSLNKQSTEIHSLQASSLTKERKDLRYFSGWFGF